MKYLLFETGQETSITKLRTIQAIATDNVGINFDTANLIFTGDGKANLSTVIKMLVELGYTGNFTY